MKNLRINKDKIISLLLAGTISLSTCGCAKQVKEKKEDIPEVTPGEIVETVYNVLYNGLKPEEAVKKLMTRDFKAE